MTDDRSFLGPGYHRFLLKLALAVFLCCLALLPFLPRSSPEFVVTVMALVVAGALAGVCAFLSRRK